MSNSDKVYTSICVLFAVLIVTGNIVYQKYVSLPLLHFYTFELSVGAILYPLTFLLTDLITEFYGKEKANFCVKLGLVMNVLIALAISIMDYLKATSWSKVDDIMFHNVLGSYGIAFIGSIIACYSAQLVDIVIYLWILKATNGRWLWLRSVGSTAISLFVDTTIVICFLTYFKILPADRMIMLIMNSYFYKLFFTIWSTPLFYASVSTIKRVLNGPVLNYQ
ncbi:MAG: hypothetical protein BGO77_08580 [Caedibacter sp. 37-49]|nr:MAG: hypothetical protein BGO77_08580 [Caedibacter sp. 37-49]